MDNKDTSHQSDFEGQIRFAGHTRLHVTAMVENLGRVLKQEYQRWIGLQPMLGIHCNRSGDGERREWETLYPKEVADIFEHDREHFKLKMYQPATAPSENDMVHLPRDKPQSLSRRGG